MATMTLAFPPSLDKFVQQQVESGAYDTPVEVVRDAMEQLQIKAEQREASIAWLRNAIQQGIDSGPPEPMDFDAVKRRGRERLAREHNL